jgi:hypothetical protein
LAALAAVAGIVLEVSKKAQAQAGTGPKSHRDELHTKQLRTWQCRERG